MRAKQRTSCLRRPGPCQRSLLRWGPAPVSTVCAGCCPEWVTRSRDRPAWHVSLHLLPASSSPPGSCAEAVAVAENFSPSTSSVLASVYSANIYQKPPVCDTVLGPKHN